MNSQFSTGFVIALVIGIAVGALWPKYGAGLSDAAVSRGHDAQEVSYTPTNGEHGGRGCSGDRDKSSNGIAARGAKHGNSGHGQGGRGCSGDCDESSNAVAARGGKHGNSGHGRGGRGCSGDCDESSNTVTARGAKHGNSGHGQGGRGCSGDCDESSNAVAARGARHGNSGRGMGRRGRTTLASIGHEQQADHAKISASKTCRESNGKCADKTTCTGEEDCGNTVATGRCNALGQDHAVSASKTEAPTQEQCQHGREHDIEHSLTQSRGPGPGLGLGLGLGWRKDFEMANDTDPDDEAQEPEKE